MMFEGNDLIPVDSTDHDYPFKQESYFYYLFGVKEPAFYATINVETEKATLYYKPSPEIYKIWMTVLSKEQYIKKYELDTFVVDDLEGHIKSMNPSKIYVNLGVNSDSGTETQIPKFKWLENYKIDKEQMHTILANSRVFKSDQEIDLMRACCKACSEGHMKVMTEVKPGMIESQLNGFFCFDGLSKYNITHTSYDSIVASGRNSATLHYIDNNKVIEKDDMILLDAGYSLQGYGSDITSCFPASGKFTKHQKEIYELVLNANQNVIRESKPGVAYSTMHLLAEKTMLIGLKNLGIVKGDIEEMIAKRVGYIFFPHGLGHLLGIDVHDVGGYLPNTPARSDKPGLKSLRNPRFLEKGMVLTVEPGCYFIDYLLEKGANDLKIDSSYVDKDKFNEYKHVGGVRIEDDILITENGNEVLTRVPRTVEEIEKFMATKEFK